VFLQLGDTPLLCAVREDKEDVVKLLVVKGANTNVVNHVSSSHCVVLVLYKDPIK